jgi:hypothetical protein
MPFSPNALTKRSVTSCANTVALVEAARAKTNADLMSFVFMVGGLLVEVFS